jgi:hypothetical protein
MSLYIRPLNLRYLSGYNIGTSYKNTETANGMDAISRLLLPSAIASIALFSPISHRDKLMLTTAAAGAHLCTSLNTRAISYIAKGALLTASFFWWNESNYSLAAASLLLPTLSGIVTERIYRGQYTSETRLQSIYAFSIPILWSLARTFLTPIKQAAVFTILPIIFSGVEYKTGEVRDDSDYKSYYVINLGIATAGIFFSAVTAFRSTSLFDRSALVSLAVLNAAHCGLILFGYGERHN